MTPTRSWFWIISLLIFSSSRTWRENGRRDSRCRMGPAQLSPRLLPLHFSSLKFQCPKSDQYFWRFGFDHRQTKFELFDTVNISNLETNSIICDFTGKKGGDNTDYGDANVYLLEYLAKEYHKHGSVTPFSIDNYVNTYWLKQYEGTNEI